MYGEGLGGKNLLQDKTFCKDPPPRSEKWKVDLSFINNSF